MNLERWPAVGVVEGVAALGVHVTSYRKLEGSPVTKFVLKYNYGVLSKSKGIGQDILLNL